MPPSLLFLIEGRVAEAVKNLPVNAGDARDAGAMPGQGAPPEEGTATHSSILAGEIPWTEKPGRL